MRLFLAMGLTLIVGLGAAFWPSDNLPGREVGVAESCRVTGGNNHCVAITCGGGSCGSNVCVSSGTGSACNSNCVIYAVCSGG
jgi:hypothetical protein